MSRVLVCVTGGIAAYKACEVVRGFQKKGWEVRVAMTEAACEFVAPLTFEALTHEPVATSLFDGAVSAIPHIDLAHWADLVVIVPATAATISRLATGLSDDIVGATCLAYEGPLLVCPAMNTAMWTNAATQANIEILKNRAVEVMPPDSGDLACGDVGSGKLPAPDVIVSYAIALLLAAEARGNNPRELKPLEGATILVTAGPTQEPIDPVRFIGNRSSGLMGYAVAEAAAVLGANVQLVTGPTSLPVPAGVCATPVKTAAEMKEAAESLFKEADAAVLVAAVADYRPVNRADQKIKKRNGAELVLELEETGDILKSLSSKKGDRVVVGFAAETTDLLEHAEAKLRRKGCDLLVANDVSRSESTFGSETNKVVLLSLNGAGDLVAENVPTASKQAIAQTIMERVTSLL